MILFHLKFKDVPISPIIRRNGASLNRHLHPGIRCIGLYLLYHGIGRPTIHNFRRRRFIKREFADQTS